MNRIKQIIFKHIVLPLAKVYWRVFKPKTYGSRVILLCDDSILLVQNMGVTNWSLPGGKLDRGETPEQCLKRELREELSLNLEKIDYKLGDYTSNREGKRDTVYIFVVQLLSKDFEKQWELHDAKWFSLDALPANTSLAGKRRIDEYLSGKRDIVGEW